MIWPIAADSLFVMYVHVEQEWFTDMSNWFDQPCGRNYVCNQMGAGSNLGECMGTDKILSSFHSLYIYLILNTIWLNPYWPITVITTLKLVFRYCKGLFHIFFFKTLTPHRDLFSFFLITVHIFQVNTADRALSLVIQQASCNYRLYLSLLIHRQVTYNIWHKVQ